MQHNPLQNKANQPCNEILCCVGNEPYYSEDSIHVCRQGNLGSSMVINRMISSNCEETLPDSVIKGHPTWLFSHCRYVHTARKIDCMFHHFFILTLENIYCHLNLTWRRAWIWCRRSFENFPILIFQVRTSEHMLLTKWSFNGFYVWYLFSSYLIVWSLCASPEIN